MSPDTIIAACGVFIACLALWLTIKESEHNRKHNRLSVMPKLVPNIYSSVTEGFVKIHVKNSGLGPAIIVGFEVCYNDNLILERDGHHLRQLASVISGSLPHVRYYSYKFHDEEVISAGDDLTLLDMELQNYTSELKDSCTTLLDAARSIAIKLNYTSMYGDVELTLDIAVGEHYPKSF